MHHSHLGETCWVSTQCFPTHSPPPGAELGCVPLFPCNLANGILAQLVFAMSRPNHPVPLALEPSDHPQVTVPGARNKHVLSYISEIVGKLVIASAHPKPPSLPAVCVRAEIDLEVASLQGLQTHWTSEEQRTHSPNHSNTSD